MIDLNPLIGFNWDAGNREKNWQRHRVSTGECEQGFFNLPLLLQDDPDHPQKEPHFLVLGQTIAGRPLFIAFTINQEKIRIISARDMSQNERDLYEQSNS